MCDTYRVCVHIFDTFTVCVIHLMGFLQHYQVGNVMLGLQGLECFGNLLYDTVIFSGINLVMTHHPGNWYPGDIQMVRSCSQGLGL